MANIKTASIEKKRKAKAAKDQGTTDNENKSGKPIFFYMPNAVYGELCQWYPSMFTVSKSQITSLIEQPIDDDDTDDASDNPTNYIITFNCAEQFMMYCKAARFRDRDRQQEILESDDPKVQKCLGRGTIGFTDESWDKVKSDVVVAGNVAKFGQNIKLGRKLLATGDRLLVEAASRDRVWGVGYTAKHAMSHREHWGENRLGRALMQVREQLRKEGEAGQAGEGGWEDPAMVMSNEQ